MGRDEDARAPFRGPVQPPGLGLDDEGIRHGEAAAGSVLLEGDRPPQQRAHLERFHRAARGPHPARGQDPSQEAGEEDPVLRREQL